MNFHPFLNLFLLLKYNLGPSDDKFWTFWGVKGPSGPLLSCAYEEHELENKNEKKFNNLSVVPLGSNK